MFQSRTRQVRDGVTYVTVFSDEEHRDRYDRGEDAGDGVNCYSRAVAPQNVSDHNFAGPVWLDCQFSYTAEDPREPRMRPWWKFW